MREREREREREKGRYRKTGHVMRTRKTKQIQYVMGNFYSVRPSQSTSRFTVKNVINTTR